MGMAISEVRYARWGCMGQSLQQYPKFDTSCVDCMYYYVNIVNLGFHLTIHTHIKYASEGSSSVLLEDPWSKTSRTVIHASADASSRINTNQCAHFGVHPS